MNRTLHYIADPMCSWCWGFGESLAAVGKILPDDVGLRYVMGGLAPDSDEPMPEGMRAHVRDAWAAVRARTGASFNFDFWGRCQPRRSTYPACRAVLAMGAAGSASSGNAIAMFEAIQRAYYTQARNPSDVEVLAAIANEVDPAVTLEGFVDLLASRAVQDLLTGDLALAARFGVSGFPSLVLERDGFPITVQAGWADPATTVAAVRAALTL